MDQLQIALTALTFERTETERVESGGSYHISNVEPSNYIKLLQQTINRSTDEKRQDPS